MHHGIPEIHQHPFAAVHTFDTKRGVPLLFGFHHNTVGQRFDVATGSASGNNQGIHNLAELTHIQLNDVFRLEIFQGANNDGVVLGGHSLLDYGWSSTDGFFTFVLIIELAADIWVVCLSKVCELLSIKQSNSDD